MSRSGYSEDYELGNWRMICWRGAVLKAIRGKRGQAFLREMLAALDALPAKRLITKELIEEGEVCALGAVAQYRNLDVSKIDPDDWTTVANTFNLSEAMAREIMYENDEWSYESPEVRFTRMRFWVENQIHG